MQAFISSTFSMKTLYKALSYEDEPHSARSKHARQCMLKELLAIPDSPASQQSKLTKWTQLLQGPLPKKHPEVYEQDVMRSCWNINGTKCNLKAQVVDKQLCMQEIDNHILAMLNELQCPLAQNTQDLNLLRYLVQDLMNQLIFVLDPDFPTHYNDQLIQKNMMLLHNSEDNAAKSHHFSLSVDKGHTLFLTAVQYWKVINSKKPTEHIGFDAQRIEIVIHLQNAERSSLLECFEKATCTLMFHGVRKTLDEIAF